MLKSWKVFISAGRVAVIILVTALALNAAEPAIPSLGTGDYEVLFFSDYFCPPCKRIDTQAEPLIRELLKTGKVRILFIDVPFHPQTKFYNKYYLYAAHANPDSKNILFVRNKLFEAAQVKRIYQEDELLTFLQGEKIVLKPLSEKNIHPLLSQAIKEANIDQTPTCVIRYSSTESKKMVGTDEIWKGLNTLKIHLEKLKR